ncbi:hypothetical protein [Ornithinicoccus halotolerans]|uniref:hypothetical protein n=1 Tax=Ornithinicoccus halotolerans TaxID=1748220 RepID=UPI001295591A|nr:hypothetical protein [Ornithinicoccus halotolerans]
MRTHIHIQNRTPTLPGTGHGPDSTASTLGRAARIWCAVMVLFWSVFPGFGLIDLEVMFYAQSGDGWEVGLEASWGVLFTFLVALPYAVVAARPQQLQPALAMLAIVAAALLLAAPLSGKASPLLAAASLTLTTAPLLPAARRTWTSPRVHAPSPGLGALTAVITTGALWYAAIAFTQSRTGAPDDTTIVFHHWPVQGALGLTVAAAAILLATWRPAERLFQITLAASLVTLALAWAMHPHTLGSVNHRLLIAATLTAGLLLALHRPRCPGYARPAAGLPREVDQP